MSPPSAAAVLPRELPYELDHDEWVAYLQERLAPESTWRPGEFDAARWLFTGDPDNPMTTSTRCRVQHCDTVVSSQQMCNRCKRSWAASDLTELEEFLATFRPSPVHARLTGQPCVVRRDGLRCQRRSISNRTGLCQAHSSLWTQQRERSGMTLHRWVTEIARPLPARKVVSTWLVYAAGVREVIEQARTRQQAQDSPRQQPKADTRGLRIDLALARAEITKLRAERDQQQHQLRRALGARLDNIGKAELLTRVDELTRANTELAAASQQQHSDNEALRARITELEDDLVAARTSLRRMIRTENRPTDT